MCFGGGSQKTYKPADAPPPPLPPADEPKIGESRIQENQKNYGQDTPSLGVRDRGGVRM